MTKLEMTTEQANERLRAMCIEASDIADSQGWWWTINARPHGKEGWAFECTVPDQPRKKPAKQLELDESEATQ